MRLKKEHPARKSPSDAFRFVFTVDRATLDQPPNRVALTTVMFGAPRSISTQQPT